jgi:hypothetical protein
MGTHVFVQQLHRVTAAGVPNGIVPGERIQVLVQSFVPGHLAYPCGAFGRGDQFDALASGLLEGKRLSVQKFPMHPHAIPSGVYIGLPLALLEHQGGKALCVALIFTLVFVDLGLGLIRVTKLPRSIRGHFVMPTPLGEEDAASPNCLDEAPTFHGWRERLPDDY